MSEVKDLTKFKFVKKPKIIPEGSYILQIVKAEYFPETKNGSTYASVKITATTVNGDKVFLKFWIGSVQAEGNIDAFEKRHRECKNFIYTVLEIEEDPDEDDWNFDVKLIPKMQDKFFRCLIYHYKNDRSGNKYPNVDEDSVVPAYGFTDYDDEE